MKKILLIHGWNYKNYYGKIHHEAWENRKEFLEELKKIYEIMTVDLPGFGLQKEPDVKKYTIEDYAKYIDNYIKTKDFKPDYILGYSFGGAVAVTYQKNHNFAQKLILVSPALIRNYKKSKKFCKTPIILEALRNSLRLLFNTQSKSTRNGIRYEVFKKYISIDCKSRNDSRCGKSSFR